VTFALSRSGVMRRSRKGRVTATPRAEHSKVERIFHTARAACATSTSGMTSVHAIQLQPPPDSLSHLRGNKQNAISQKMNKPTQSIVLQDDYVCCSHTKRQTPEVQVRITSFFALTCCCCDQK